jgi:hypothetical protein
MYSSTLPSTSALDEVGSQHHVPTALPPGKTQYPLYRRLGGPQGRLRRVQKILAPTGIRSPDRPAHSQSLYRVDQNACHSAHKIYMAKAKILGPSTEIWVLSYFEQIPIPCTCWFSFHDTKTSTSRNVQCLRKRDI